MTYETAITKGWENLKKAAKEKTYNLTVLTDEYEINPENKRILSLSCNIPAGEYLTILILHYLIRKLKDIPRVSGEWISFKQLTGSLGYYPTFKKRVIGRILRKFGARPEIILRACEHLNAKPAQLADISIVIEAFKGVPVLITLWRGDEEFDPEANIHFDRTVSEIFCTEDIIAMSDFIISKI